VKSGVVDQIRAAGGEVYGVTSEPQRLADRAREEWELGFECVGDPHQEIPETARERGWLEIFVQTRLEFLRQSAIDFEPTHPKGYFQPGVLVLSREGRVLYRWRSVPSHKNVGGAMVRPTAEHVWSSIRSVLAEGSDGADAAYDDQPEMDSASIPWPLFVSLLIANGWFLRPVPFGQRKHGPTPQQRIQIAMVRLGGFAALWIAAFAMLPTFPVVAVFVAWIAWIIPKIRWVNLEFQDIRDA
jgi:peroxiredoxin